MTFSRRLRYVLPRSTLDVLVLVVLALGVVLVVTARQEQAEYYAHEVRREVTAKLFNVDERTKDVWDADDEEWDTHYFYRVTYRYFLDDKPYIYTREYEDSAPRSNYAQEEKVHAYQGEDGA